MIKKLFWTAAWEGLTEEDCKAYIYQVTITRTYDGFSLEKSVITDGLAAAFPEVKFEESSPELDHAGDIDYLGRVGERAFGIQIKPITASANFGNYNISERMRANFQDFDAAYGGSVFIVFSTPMGNKKDIVNKHVVEDIQKEIGRLKNERIRPTDKIPRN